MCPWQLATPPIPILWLCYHGSSCPLQGGSVFSVFQLVDHSLPRGLKSDLSKPRAVRHGHQRRFQSAFPFIFLLFCFLPDSNKCSEEKSSTRLWCTRPLSAPSAHLWNIQHPQKYPRCVWGCMTGGVLFDCHVNMQEHHLCRSSFPKESDVSEVTKAADCLSKMGKPKVWGDKHTQMLFTASAPTQTHTWMLRFRFSAAHNEETPESWGVLQNIPNVPGIGTMDPPGWFIRYLYAAAKVASGLAGGRSSPWWASAGSPNLWLKGEKASRNRKHWTAENSFVFKWK